MDIEKTYNELMEYKDRGTALNINFLERVEMFVEACQDDSKCHDLICKYYDLIGWGKSADTVGEFRKRNRIIKEANSEDLKKNVVSIQAISKNIDNLIDGMKSAQANIDKSLNRLSGEIDNLMKEMNIE